MHTCRFALAFVALGSAVAIGCGSGVSPDATLVGSGSDAAGRSDAASPPEDGGVMEGAEGGPPSDSGAVAPPVVYDSGPCQPNFASGVNVAWVKFAADVPGPNIGVFQTVFQNTYAAGGRVARWWFHTNAAHTPRYDPNTGLAMTILDTDIADVRSILDTAHTAGMMVTISLWSFDMLKGSLASTTLQNNVDLLTKDANRQAYIDNVLTPLATALAGHPGLYAWETFNEPEGMVGDQAWGPFTNARGPDGGTIVGRTVGEKDIQKSINLFASAIHNADPKALVTNGTWEFLANSNAPGMTNFYSDSALQSAGGMANGVLDFYEVHYYASDTPKYSPFEYPVSHWALDKPVVIGEFYALDQALDQGTVLAADTYTMLYTGKYKGAWAWQYLQNDCRTGTAGCQTTMWPTMQKPLQNLAALAPNDLSCQ